jgi:hypothetical protein
MSIGTWFESIFGAGASASHEAGQGGLTDHHSINPATSLPMVGSIDIMGNPFGVDLNPPHHWDHGHAGGISHGGIGITDPMPPIASYDPNRGW